MNISKPTVEEIKNEIHSLFANSEDMINEILNKGPLRNAYINLIKTELISVVKYTRVKNIKEYKRDCARVIMHYLNAGELKNIYELEGRTETKNKTENISKKNIELVMNTLADLGMLNEITGTSEWAKTVNNVYEIINQ